MTPDMELALPARAENIALIRHAFGALGEALAVDEELLSDVRLAVTEACANVVVHAYAEDGPPGPLEVLAALDSRTLTVVVRDRGPGIAPHPDSPGLGLGLPLIASLAESVQLGRDEQERTEVCMTFSLSGAHTNGAVAGASDASGPHDAAGDSEASATAETSPAGGRGDRIDPTTRT
jgi:anti-sigma regulatory factor (Ser/Thr protein kinase)